MKVLAEYSGASARISEDKVITMRRSPPRRTGAGLGKKYLQALTEASYQVNAGNREISASIPLRKRLGPK